MNTFKKSHYLNMLFLALYFFVSAFYFNTPSEIIEGLIKILTSTSVLVSDYFVIGNIGSTFFNAAIILIVCLSLPYYLKMPLNGALMAALFTVTGFALFGKNLVNIWAIVLGVYLYSRMVNEDFRAHLPVAYFSTALSPSVSVVLFGLNLPLWAGIPFALFIGIFTGWIFPPLAKQFFKFHQGYSLYNSGFTAGIIGMVYMALLRSYNISTVFNYETLSGYTGVFQNYLLVLFVVMFFIGWFQSSKRLENFKKLHDESGILGSDFIEKFGFGIALMNMSVIGLATMLYVVLIGGELNGPSVGAILTVVGFGAFGKHLKNIIPIMIGVYIAAYLKIWEPHSVSAILAALFGTTLAPIAGQYGVMFGVIAGFLHMALVMNIGFLHGGINLYNNGFSGGFVAAILVPLIHMLPSSKRITSTLNRKKLKK